MSGSLKGCISHSSTDPMKLKISGELLWAWTKIFKTADFQNLPWGQFYSHFTDLPKFQVAIKMPSGQVSKIGLFEDLSLGPKKLPWNFQLPRISRSKTYVIHAKRPIMSGSLKLIYNITKMNTKPNLSRIRLPQRGAARLLPHQCRLRGLHEENFPVRIWSRRRDWQGRLFWGAPMSPQANGEVVCSQDI